MIQVRDNCTVYYIILELSGETFTIFIGFDWHIWLKLWTIFCSCYMWGIFWGIRGGTYGSEASKTVWPRASRCETSAFGRATAAPKTAINQHNCNKQPWLTFQKLLRFILRTQKHETVISKNKPQGVVVLCSKYLRLRTCCRNPIIRKLKIRDEILFNKQLKILNS